MKTYIQKESEAVPVTAFSRPETCCCMYSKQDFSHILLPKQIFYPKPNEKHPCLTASVILKQTIYTYLYNLIPIE